MQGVSPWPRDPPLGRLPSSRLAAAERLPGVFEFQTTTFLLGLMYNAVPGPVLGETIHRELKGGYRSALAVQFGSLVGDALWAAPASASSRNRMV